MLSSLILVGIVIGCMIIGIIIGFKIFEWQRDRRFWKDYKRNKK